MSLGSRVVVVRAYSDFYILVIAEQSESEVFLTDLLDVVTNCLSHFCGNKLSLGVLFKYYTEALLVLDEVISDGLVVSLDSEEIIARIIMNDKSRDNKTSCSKKGLFI